MTRAPSRGGRGPLHRSRRRSARSTTAACATTPAAPRCRARALALQAVPDWKLDRLVIRIALYGRERLGLEPGTPGRRVRRPGWLWPVATSPSRASGPPAWESSTMSRTTRSRPPSATPSRGSSRDRRRERCAAPGAAAAGRCPGTALIAEGAGGSGESAPARPAARARRHARHRRARAGVPHAVPRSVPVERRRCGTWGRAGPSGSRTRRRWSGSRRGSARSRPQPGDVVYLRPPSATLAARLALAAFVGDGLTETALGGDGRPRGGRAARARTSCRSTRAWVESGCRRPGPRWPAGSRPRPRAAPRAASGSASGCAGWRRTGLSTRPPSARWRPRVSTLVGEAETAELPGTDGRHGQRGGNHGFVTPAARREVWQAFQAVNLRVAEGSSVAPAWAPRRAAEVLRAHAAAARLPARDRLALPALRGRHAEGDPVRRARSSPTSWTGTSARSGRPSTRRATRSG